MRTFNLTPTASADQNVEMNTFLARGYIDEAAHNMPLAILRLRNILRMSPLVAEDAKVMRFIADHAAEIQVLTRFLDHEYDERVASARARMSEDAKPFKTTTSKSYLDECLICGMSEVCDRCADSTVTYSTTID